MSARLGTTFPDPAALLSEAQKEAAKEQPVAAPGVRSYAAVILVLVDEKGFSWREVCEFFEARGMTRSAATYQAAYRKAWEKIEREKAVPPKPPGTSPEGFWEAVDEYCLACGGDPKGTFCSEASESSLYTEAVVGVERFAALISGGIAEAPEVAS